LRAADAEVVEADAEVEVDVLRGPEEGFLPPRERHVVLLLGPALGRARAVAERLPLDLPEVARPPHNVEPGPVPAQRVKVQPLGSVPGPAVERQIALPGAVHQLGTLISSSMSLVRQAARESLARHEGAAPRPIFCKEEAHNSQRELPAVLP
jgi:hypothetical protein